jgi:hypothetical protein
MFIFLLSHLMLRSLNTITKEAPMTSRRLRRASPDPRLGSEIELSSRDTGSLFDLLGIGKTLASERITAEEPPTDSNQPSCRLSQQAKVGNEDVMDARMPFQPGTRLEIVVTTEIVGDDEEIPSRIVSFDVGQQSDVAAFRYAQQGTGSVLCHRAPVAPRRPRFSRARAHSPAAL